MHFRAITAFGTTLMLMVSASYIYTSYVCERIREESIIIQINECGNYWFPVNIICSNKLPSSR